MMPWYFAISLAPMLPVEFLRLVRICLNVYSLLFGVALVMSKEIAFKTSALTLSQSLKVLQKLKIVLLNN